ncbi:phage integrase Arm DNA-binding domain-containing protein [Pelomonas sp. V22]|uniref:tyrosine-type recombinase/integrase n=1 Tax=Pelomonas sp. V22 TaxID=2822139 RepID=UPI0024A94EAC|nr:tyrosine-type recombinase/integrase [Pelomonas sp. V22]MDI4633341.1 phage integrase Arm DNA-binding domain-containing protein [Pelomonas sp. V22]
MNAARRSARKRDWPRGLYEPRPGYFTWRHPTTGKTHAIGAVPLAVARNEALAANQFVADQKPSLVARLEGVETCTVAELTKRLPVSEKANTAKAARSLDKRINAFMGDRACDAVTTKLCADLIDAVLAEGKERLAQAVRSRLVSIFNFGITKGLLDSNPADPTARPDATVKRGRLTLEQFKAIYAEAPKVAEWLQQAMMFALVTGADRATIASTPRDCIKDGCMLVRRVKTGALIGIPLDLRLEAVGVSVRDVAKHRTGVISPLLLHHVSQWGNAPTGSKVHPDRISHAFTDARKLAKIPDEGAPTFHEIRSLCKRLYTQQGGVDTKALLGHADEKTAAIYADPRGIEPIYVKVG